MKKYDWILFDADETLFHFDSFSGLQLMFSRYNFKFTENDFKGYQSLNKSLWFHYQNGRISAHALQAQRFEPWAQKLQVNPHELNSAFLQAMADICQPLEGAQSLLTSLENKYKLGIITNGFTELQQIRLERTGLKNHFEIIVISEEVGIAKPDPGIFDHAFEKMGQPNRDSVLMVGDTLESDILGGINSGLDTCWLNRDNKVHPANIAPKYKVTSLAELESLLTYK